MSFFQKLFATIANATISLALLGGVTVAQAGKVDVFGRWTADSQDVFSDKGRPYKTIDIVTCEDGMCAVSVGDGGECGPTLFKISGEAAPGGKLTGTSRWHKEMREVEIEFRTAGLPGGPGIILSLASEESSFSSRLSMPTFIAVYVSAGEARCPSPEPVS